MRRVLFLDLDDTVVSSRRKTADPEAEVAGFSTAGSPDTLMSRRQRAVFDWLVEGAEVVPTTARNVAALRRLVLPFHGWAICSFGGVILRPDGTSDPDWHAQAVVQADAHHAQVARALSAFEEAADAVGVPIRARILEDEGLPLYVSAKSAVSDGAALARIVPGVRAATPAGWALHWNDNSVAVLPPWLGKSHAVRRLRSIFGPDHVAIGAGDSHTDVPFMADCDFALTPSASQVLKRALLHAESV